MSDELPSLLDAEAVDGLPWLTPLVAKLRTQAVAGRFPPSLVLTGVAGMGKRALAAHFVRLLLCTDAAHAPCGRCRQCEMTSAQTHPDFMQLTMEDKSAVIKVDAIRDLTHFAVQSPQTAAVKVIVVEPAEAMNLAAANAFLKTLEEPSAKTFFMLIHDGKSPLLPTIRSRCQRVSFMPPPRAESVAWLAGRGVNEAAALAALDLTAQAPLAALAIANDGAMARRGDIITALGAFIKGDLALDAAVKSWCSVTPEELIPWQMSWLEQMTRYAMTKDASALSDPAAFKMLQYLADRNPSSAMLQFYDVLRELRSDLRQVSGLNKDLMVIRMLSGWQALMRQAKLLRRQA